jgi:protein-S-isoprenylcysteine O-methyltransferase Ste14
MFLRALLAFLVLPGVVAFGVPALIAPRAQFHIGPVSATVFCLGVVLLLWTVVAFYVNGKGTLAPWSPPRHLVTAGLYRFSRNPMYIGVLLILCGWALLFRSSVLVWYTVAIAVMFHLRVVLGEEPWLARTHGAEWRAYTDAVPRWLVQFPRRKRANDVQ